MDLLDKEAHNGVVDEIGKAIDSKGSRGASRTFPDRCLGTLRTNRQAASWGNSSARCPHSTSRRMV